MEANPYACFLGDREPVAVIASTYNGLRTLTGRCTREQIERRPAPGKWSVREIVAHLADCELVFAFRLRQTLAEDHPVVQPFNQEQWAARYGNHDFDAAMSMFHATRDWNLLLIDGLAGGERLRQVTHPERGTMTLWTIVETMAGHDLNHLGQIERLLPA